MPVNPFQTQTTVTEDFLEKIKKKKKKLEEVPSGFGISSPLATKETPAIAAERKKEGQAFISERERRKSLLLASRIPKGEAERLASAGIREEEEIESAANLERERAAKRAEILAKAPELTAAEIDARLSQVEASNIPEIDERTLLQQKLGLIQEKGIGGALREELPNIAVAGAVVAGSLAIGSSTALAAAAPIVKKVLGLGLLSIAGGAFGLKQSSIPNTIKDFNSALDNSMDAARLAVEAVRIREMSTITAVSTLVDIQQNINDLERAAKMFNKTNLRMYLSGGKAVQAEIKKRKIELIFLRNELVRAQQDAALAAQGLEPR